MHGSILPVTIPPGQPRGQVQPFGPGGGELFEAVLSRGEGQGKSKITSCCSCEVRHFSVDAGPRGEDCLYFQGESLEFVADWLEKISLKIKICIRRYFYFKLLNECAFDAYSNSWRSSQTKIYFFCERIYVYTKTT